MTSPRTRLSSLAATVLVAPVAVVATATSAQAAPDPGDMVCEQPYVSYQQVDRTHVKVRTVAKICSGGMNRMMSLNVKRGGRWVKDLNRNCDYRSICKMSTTVRDPKGVQSWFVVSSVYTMERGYGVDRARWKH